MNPMKKLLFINENGSLSPKGCRIDYPNYVVWIICDYIEETCHTSTETTTVIWPSDERRRLLMSSDVLPKVLFC